MINIRTLKRLFPECTIEKEIPSDIDKELGNKTYEIKGEHIVNIIEKLKTIAIEKDFDYNFSIEKLYRNKHYRIYVKE